MDAAAPRGHVDETTLASLLAKLTVEDKATLVSGSSFWTLPSLPKIGLRQMTVSDGPNGVRGVTWDERDTSPLFPVASAIAATWDRDVARAAGSGFGVEARRRGIHVVLAPTVNVHRSPYGGRNFENFSEDPLLVAEIGAEITAGVQQHGVAATPKHFVANDSETERQRYDVVVDPDTLRDVYLKPFRRIVRRAGPWALMAAYNAVNGRRMTENDVLVNDVVKGEWNWDGAVVSDWFATTSVDAAALGGLDLVMPGEASPWGEGALARAVREERVPETVLDDKVLRILRLAARTGALDAAPVDTGSNSVGEAAEPTGTERDGMTVRDMATRGFVLLRNDTVANAPMLPLRAPLRKIAVIGENAVTPVVQGGGSSQVNPDYVVTPLEGVRAALPETTVVYQRGVRHRRLLDTLSADEVLDPHGAGNGFRVEYLGSDGAQLGHELRGTQRLLWMGREGMPDATHSMRATGKLRVGAGEHIFGVHGVGGFRVEIAGREVLAERVTLPAECDDPLAVLVEPPERRFHVVLVESDFDDDGTVSFTVEFDAEGIAGLTGFGIGHRSNEWDDASELEAAVEVARDADVAVVVVGTSIEVETEGKDRSSLDLPGGQDELVRRVAQANPRSVVVVNAGSPVLLPWVDSVPAVLWTWFGSQEYGNALADVLLGEAEPGGRMPMTLPAELSDVPVPAPALRPTDGKLYYSEGDQIGYRAYARDGTIPAFDFGAGQGYTDWDYADVTDDGDHVRVRLRNIGERDGSEVVQVYATGDVTTPRLVGFAKVAASAGEEVEVSIELDELGANERGLMVGRDLRLTAR